MRGALLLALLVGVASCSSSACYLNCVPGYEQAPNTCTCRPIADAGSSDLPSERTDATHDGGGALASCAPATGCGAGSTCIEGCPASAKPSIGAVPGICSVPARDTCGCGAVLDPCDTPGTVCLMPSCCDYEGICVTPAERAAICARAEGAHFDCSAADAGP